MFVGPPAPAVPQPWALTQPPLKRLPCPLCSKLYNHHEEGRGSPRKPLLPMPAISLCTNAQTWLCRGAQAAWPARRPACFLKMQQRHAERKKAGPHKTDGKKLLQSSL